MFTKKLFKKPLTPPYFHPQIFLLFSKMLQLKSIDNKKRSAMDSDSYFDEKKTAPFRGG